MEKTYKQIIYTLMAGLFAMVVVVAIISVILIGERNDLVKQTCDYSRVAGVDTVRELCTKFQQQTDTEYYCNLKDECWVKAND